MRLSTLLFLLIPALAALGHDAYLFYDRHLDPGLFSFDLLMEEFKLSALGFLWTNYSIDTYKTAVSSMPPEDWAKIDALLTLKTFYVGLAFAVVASVVIMLFNLLAGNIKMPSKSFDSGKPNFRAGSKSKPIKYKRK